MQRGLLISAAVLLGFIGVTHSWHLTSVAWWGFGALLLVLAFGSGGISGLGTVVAATLLLTGVVILMTAGFRHPAWSLFLLAGAVTLYATW